MAKCQICGKKSKTAGHFIKTRGQYNPTGKQRRKANIQTIYVPKGITKEPYKKFAGKKITACAKCIKGIAK